MVKSKLKPSLEHACDLDNLCERDINKQSDQKTKLKERNRK